MAKHSKTTVKRICAHYIEFTYFSQGKYAVPDESEEEHVKMMLNDGIVEGELCMNKVVQGMEREYRGWWKIQRSEPEGLIIHFKEKAILEDLLNMAASGWYNRDVLPAGFNTMREAEAGVRKLLKKVRDHITF